MKVLRFDLNNIPSLEEPLFLCLGNFDGMHLGHQEVLFQCLYDGSGAPAILFIVPTLEAKSLPFLSKSTLMNLEAKENFVRNKKIEYCLEIKASKDFFALSPLDFIHRVLKQLPIKEIFCGSDYSFGKGGAGDIALLKKHFKVHEIPLLEKDHQKISSRDIRHLIEEGKMKEAISLLGHPYTLSSKIQKGYQRGKSIGFPTANLELNEEMILPKAGVYYGYAYLLGKPYQAMINIGNNPTFQNDQVTMEVHLIGYEGEDLYGHYIHVDFLGYLRGEVTFSNVDELILQLKHDQKEITSILETSM